MQSLEFLKAWRDKSRQWQDRIGPVAFGVSEEQASEALTEGTPLAAVSRPPIDGRLFADVLSDLAGLLTQHSQADVSPLRAALGTSDKLDSLAQGALVQDIEALTAWAAEHKVDPNLLYALAGLALQPFLARYAKAATDVAIIETWRENYCPVCGREPDVARIDPDNLRFLHCPQCDTQWQHHRLTCVRCGTDDVKKVRLLMDPEMEPWRVEVCDVCGDYCKTLDQRHGGVLAMPRVDLFVEDARTVRLDLLAEQEGYRRGGRTQ